MARRQTIIDIEVPRTLASLYLWGDSSMPWEVHEWLARHMDTVATVASVVVVRSPAPPWIGKCFPGYVIGDAGGLLIDYEPGPVTASRSAAPSLAMAQAFEP